MREESAIPTLVITADDYGYRPSYNRGILEAARAEAVDAASAMVEREFCDPEPLLATGVEIGLHLELPEAGEEGAAAALLAQLQRFEELFGRPPAHLDGHHHCHARPGTDSVVAQVAAEQTLPVRSADARHRRLLHAAGVATPDRTLGRLDPSEPALPPELERVLAGDAPPTSVTEWFVHPGYRDPERVSSYDAAREEDLRVVLEVQRGGRLARWR